VNVLSHHDSDSDHSIVSLIGCVMTERDYRSQNDLGRGGFIGTGAGVGNEFILTNAMPAQSANPSAPTDAECAAGTASGGRTYELKGSVEEDLEPFLGRRMEITGYLDEAKAELTVGTSGEVEATQATGGSNIGRDLKLFELEVESFREAPAVAPRPVAVAPPPPEPAPAPAPEPTPPAVVEEGVAVIETPAAPQLPTTASPLALAGLLGLLSLGGSLGLRRWRL
jgi:hypothetical protein